MRLFGLPRSSWADYDATKISAGGGVYPRGAKSITLSKQAGDVLGLPEGAHEPAAVMRAILTADVDLLYFGGIGTYVKGAGQSQADAGDRANDAIRVDAGMLRAKVLGEGANLAVTQPGRIEAAQNGVRINTDALDNSAGVSTSDHEVNIKILVADAVESGRLTEPQRVQLLASMTDEVGRLVLYDNHQQSQAISLACWRAPALPAQNALCGVLERAGILDRAVAGLPDSNAMTARGAAGQGLTRPELCEVMAHGKLWLSGEIDAGPLPDDPALEGELVAYFPAVLGEQYGTEVRRHRLRREIILMRITNNMVNRSGTTFVFRLAEETGCSTADVTRAHLAAWEMFGMPGLWSEIEGLGSKVAGPVQVEALPGSTQARRAGQPVAARAPPPPARHRRHRGGLRRRPRSTGRSSPSARRPRREGLAGGSDEPVHASRCARAAGVARRRPAGALRRAGFERHRPFDLARPRGHSGRVLRPGRATFARLAARPDRRPAAGRSLASAGPGGCPRGFVLGLGVDRRRSTHTRRGRHDGSRAGGAVAGAHRRRGRPVPRRASRASPRAAGQTWRRSRLPSREIRTLVQASRPMS